jgi:cytochrome c oxidase subunit 2
MPGYVNKLRVRFPAAGDYEVLCLEYCGVAHHAMRTVIRVRAGS